MKFKEALQTLRQKTEKRNFDQTLDLIINLKSFDIKREAFSAAISLPHPYKELKVCAFLENKGTYPFVTKVITKIEMDKVNLKDIKKIARQVDFFIANAKLMPSLASKFGKVLGSMGKMPDPSIGCVITTENGDVIKDSVDKLKKIVKVKTKDLSIKMPIGKESKSDDELIKNMETSFNIIFDKLPKKELNLKNVMIKFTMGHPVKVEK